MRPCLPRGAAYYVKRYAEQAEYRERLEAAYPQYAGICEAVGAAPGCVEAHLEAAASGAAGAATAAGIVCRDGMVLRDGRCGPDAPEGGGGGWLAATAAYEADLAPQVQAVRKYGDGTLMAAGHEQDAMAGDRLGLLPRAPRFRAPHGPPRAARRRSGHRIDMEGRRGHSHGQHHGRGCRGHRLH